jgi:hypothetical protein
VQRLEKRACSGQNALWTRFRKVDTKPFGG